MRVEAAWVGHHWHGTPSCENCPLHLLSLACITSRNLPTFKSLQTEVDNFKMRLTREHAMPSEPFTQEMHIDVQRSISLRHNATICDNFSTSCNESTTLQVTCLQHITSDGFLVWSTRPPSQGRYMSTDVNAPQRLPKVVWMLAVAPKSSLDPALVASLRERAILTNQGREHKAARSRYTDSTAQVTSGITLTWAVQLCMDSKVLSKCA
eukprot:1364869-Amphidinium_carterae.1